MHLFVCQLLREYAQLKSECTHKTPAIPKSLLFRVIQRSHAVIMLTVVALLPPTLLLIGPFSRAQWFGLLVLLMFGVTLNFGMSTRTGAKHLAQITLVQWLVYALLAVLFDSYGLSAIYVGLLPTLAIMLSNGYRQSIISGALFIVLLWVGELGFDTDWITATSDAALIRALLGTSVAFAWLFGFSIVLVFVLANTSSTRAARATRLLSAKREAEQRGAMLHFLANAGQHFLAHSDWNLAIDKVLALLAGTLSTEYAALLKTDQDDEKGWYMKIAHLYHNAADHVEAPRLDPEMPLYFDEVGITAWRQALMRGTPLPLDVSQTDPATQEILAHFGLSHILLVPVLADDTRLWGILGIGRRAAQAWVEAEVDTMRSLAEVLSVAIRRHRIEEQLVTINNHQSALLNAIPDALLTMNLDGTVRRALTRLEQHRDLPTDVYNGTNFLRYLRADEHPRFLNQLQRAYESGKSHGGLYHATSYEGTRYVLDIRTSISGPNETLNILRDVTDQYELESELRASEARFRALFEHTPDMLVLLGAESGNIVDTSPAVERILGRPRQELINRNYSELLQGPENNLTTVIHDTRHAPHRPHHLETMMYTADGKLLPIDATAVLITLQGDAYVLLAMRDISYRTEIDMLSRALRLERELHVLQSTFVETVSHQFRTPLTVMQLSMEILTNYGDRLSDEKRAKRFGTIKEQIQRMEFLLDAVLAYGEAGLSTFDERAPIDVATVVRDVVAKYNQRSGQPRISMQIDAGIPPIDADRNALEQIIMNPLDNALKYSMDKMVSVSVRQTPDGVELLIADTGLGIPTDVLPLVCEPFQRGPNVNTIEGTGLGLTTTRRAVLSHQGNLNIESTLNVGTTVRIWLPYGTSTTTKPDGQAPQKPQ